MAVWLSVKYARGLGVVGLRLPATATPGSVYYRGRAATFAIISRAGYGSRGFGRLRFIIHETSHRGSRVDPLATGAFRGLQLCHLALLSSSLAG